MALTGSFYTFSTSEHPTETVSYTASYPAQLPEEDPNYEKRGTEEIVTEPLIVETAHEHEGHYAVIKVATIHNHWWEDNEGGKYVGSNILYNVYSSSEDRKSAPHNPSIGDAINMVEFNYEYTNPESRSLMDWAYDVLKTQPAFISMSNC